jgi:hypothetical protein
MDQSPFLIGLQFFNQSRNSSHFMKHEGSLPHTQAPAVCLYPENSNPVRVSQFLRQTGFKLLGQIKRNSVNDFDFARFQASAAV